MKLNGIYGLIMLSAMALAAQPGDPAPQAQVQVENAPPQPAEHQAQQHIPANLMDEQLPVGEPVGLPEPMAPQAQQGPGEVGNQAQEHPPANLMDDQLPVGEPVGLPEPMAPQAQHGPGEVGNQAQQPLQQPGIVDLLQLDPQNQPPPPVEPEQVGDPALGQHVPVAQQYQGQPQVQVVQQPHQPQGLAHEVNIHAQVIIPPGQQEPAHQEIIPPAAHQGIIVPGQQEDPHQPPLNPNIPNPKHQENQEQQKEQDLEPKVRTPDMIQAEIDAIRQNIIAQIDTLNATAMDKAPLENLKSAIKAEEGVDIKATITSALSGVDSKSAALVSALEQMASFEEAATTNDVLYTALSDATVKQALTEANQRIAASIDTGLTAEQLAEQLAAQRLQSGTHESSNQGPEKEDPLKKESRLNSLNSKPKARPHSEDSKRSTSNNASSSSKGASHKKKTLNKSFLEEYKAAIAVAIVLTTIIVAAGVIALLRYRKVI